MEAWKPMVVSPSPETGRRLRAALVEAGVREPALLGDYPAPGALASLAAQHGCNLCFVDLAGDQDRALAAIAEAAAAAQVVALNPRQDADVMLRALRRGAGDFLSDASPEQVRGVLERLDKRNATADAPRQGRLYCVTPGKAGCGASTIAIHLAAEERSAGRAVLLVDADPLTGGAAFLLKLKSEHHLDDVLRDWKRMDEDLWRRLVASWGGVEVVLAPEDPAARCAITPELAADLASFWRDRYHIIIVDTPDARVAVDSGFAALADAVVLVTTNELSPLHATRRAVDLLERAASVRGRLRLVLNRYDRATGLSCEDVRTALGIEPFATLANDYDLLQNAVLEGRPAAANSRFGTGVGALSRALCGAPAALKKTGWLSRLALRK